MSKRNLQTILLAGLIVIGFGLVFVLSDMLEARRAPDAYEDEDLYLSSERIKAFSGDFSGLVSDWYWINSLQYIGRKIVKAQDAGKFHMENLRPLDPAQLYPLLDRTTTLDPHHMTAFIFGAIILPAVDEDLAIKLTEKGIAANPKEWVLFQHLGYIYWQRGDYEKAGQVYGQGATIENAPAFMKQMAAKVRLEGGTRETAREIYQHIYDTAPDDQTREMIALRLGQIVSLYERDKIREALQEFQKKNGRCAGTWQEISGQLRAIRMSDGKGLAIAADGSPIDPSGAAYRLLNSEGKCDVDLDPVKSKLPPG